MCAAWLRGLFEGRGYVSRHSTSEMKECSEMPELGCRSQIQQSVRLLLLGIYTGCLQMSGAVSKVNKKFISHLTRAKPTPSVTATVQSSHALAGVRSLVLTAGPRGQFTRWRRSRKRLSVCSVLRCPDL